MDSPAHRKQLEWGVVGGGWRFIGMGPYYSAGPTILKGVDYALLFGPYYSMAGHVTYIIPYYYKTGPPHRIVGPAPYYLKGYGYGLDRWPARLQ